MAQVHVSLEMCSFSFTSKWTNQLQLVTADGNAVLDESGDSIMINGQVKDLTISNEGEMVVTTTDGGEQNFNLGVVSVKKPQFLEKLGGNLYGLPTNFTGLGVTKNDILTSLTGNLREGISMKQGTLETSNVDLSKEMTDLITAQECINSNHVQSQWPIKC